MILDLEAPDGDGIDLIRDLRQWSHIPVLVLSARADETDKVMALDAGADDYLTKPFGISELLARVRVALRRYARKSQPDPVFRFGDISVDLINRRVTKISKNSTLPQLSFVYSVNLSLIVAKC